MIDNTTNNIELSISTKKIDRTLDSGTTTAEYLLEKIHKVQKEDHSRLLEFCDFLKKLDTFMKSVYLNSLPEIDENKILEEITKLSIDTIKSETSYVFKYEKDKRVKLISYHKMPELSEKEITLMTDLISEMLNKDMISFLENEVNLETMCWNAIDIWEISEESDNKQCALFLPIVRNHRERLIYVLVITHRDPQFFSHEVMSAFKILAYLIGLHLNNLNFKKSTNERASELVSTDKAESTDEAYKELEELSYSISHDLNSPINIIHNNCEWISTNYSHVLDPAANRILKQTISTAEHMKSLLDGLLEFSRYVRATPKQSLIDMNSLVRNVCNELLDSDDNPGAVSITIRPLLSANGDATLIRQVWYNLISNAFKFTRYKQKRKIEISSLKKDNEIVYCVADNGVGFDMQYANKLFNAFSRLHSIEEFEGTGVGLAIVNRIVRRHGGRVWAEAKVDNGANFYFTLPINKSQG